MKRRSEVLKEGIVKKGGKEAIYIWEMEDGRWKMKAHVWSSRGGM